MKERKSITIPANVIRDKLINDSEFRLLSSWSLNFGTAKVTINDQVILLLGYSRSTFYRMLSSLIEIGYIEHDAGGETYCISVPKMRLVSPKNETHEREEERTKEEEIDNTIEYIYNNNIIRDTENVRERDKREREVSDDGADVEEKPKRKVFVPPTVEEVREYCRSRQSTVLAQSFVDFYESKGWMVGKNRMKDWKAAVRTWEAKDKASGRRFIPSENRTLSADDYPF